MSISVADNFSYQGAKPLDARFQFSSVANMKAATEATLYNGCFAYVTENKKYYTFDSSNTSDSTTGKWREYSSGSGEDTNAYHTDDTAETTLADNDYFPFYDTSATGKRRTLWSNIKSVLKTYFDTLYSTTKTRGTPTSAGTTLSLVNTGDMYNWNNKQNALTAGTNIGISGNTISATNTLSLTYSTSEQAIGKWTNGATLYQKTVQGTTNSTAKVQTYFASGLGTSANVVDISGCIVVNKIRVPLNFYYSDSNLTTFSGCYYNNGNIFIIVGHSDYCNKTCYVTLRYTK